MIGVGDPGELLDLFVSIFEGRGQAQRRAVARTEGPTIHLVTEQRLRVEQCGEIQPRGEDAIGRLHRDVRGQRSVRV